MTTPTLLRGNLKEQLVSALKVAILSGEMAPGTVYKMGEIGDRFGASRTPVREAVMDLESRGLVEIIRSVGFRVATPSHQELADLLEVREHLEIPAMAGIAGRLSPAALTRARELSDAIEGKAEANDLVGYFELDRAFHVHLVEQFGNAKLAELVSELRDRQRVPGLRTLVEAGVLVRRHEEHQQILSAVETGDAKAVRRLVRQHLALNRT